MSKFMFIFRGGEQLSSAEEQQQHMQKWFTWVQALTRDGVYDGQGAPLERTGGAVVRGRKKTISDGPYAEAKDLVGGYIVVEARDLAAAVELAKGCPTYELDGAVEVRPVQKI